MLARKAAMHSACLSFCSLEAGSVNTPLLSVIQNIGVRDAKSFVPFPSANPLLSYINTKLTTSVVVEELFLKYMLCTDCPLCVLLHFSMLVQRWFVSSTFNGMETCFLSDLKVKLPVFQSNWLHLLPYILANNGPQEPLPHSSEEGRLLS